MAPGPRVLLSNKDKVLHEAERSRDEEEDDDDSPTNYYESEKVLGELYRSIDEQQFLEDIHTNIRRTSASRNKVLTGIWKYAASETFHTRPEFSQWSLYLDTAKDIRERYLLYPFQVSALHLAHFFSQLRIPDVRAHDPLL